MDLPTGSFQLSCLALRCIADCTEHTTDNGDRCNDGRRLEIVRARVFVKMLKIQVLSAVGAQWQSLCHAHSHTLTLTRSVHASIENPRPSLADARTSHRRSCIELTYIHMMN